MTTNFITHNIPSNIFLHLPKPDSPWISSEPLAQRVQTIEESLGFRKVVVLPTDPEWDAVGDAFNQPRRLPHCWVRRAYLIDNQGLLEAFINGLTNINDIASKFPPEWRNLYPNRDREIVIERWNRLAGDRRVRVREGESLLEKIRVLPLWHGSPTAEKVDSICQIGFIAPGRHPSTLEQQVKAGTVKDGAFFGVGSYFTDSARYAREKYGEEEVDLLLSLVSTGEPYPVIRSDYEPIKVLEMCPKKDNHFSHFIPVNPPAPTPTDGLPTCDELVVFEPRQILPRFVVSIGRGAPKSFAEAQTKGELADRLIYLLDPGSMDEPPNIDAATREALRIKAGSLLLAGEGKPLSAHDRIFAQIAQKAIEGTGTLTQQQAKEGLSAIAREILPPSLPPSIEEEKREDRFLTFFNKYQGMILTVTAVCALAIIAKGVFSTTTYERGE